MEYDELIRFHGHSCPGLAIGYRMAMAGLDHLDLTRSRDEELVAIVENDACGVDALQCLSGCTFGKGNLVFRDYGKQVYTLYDRKTGRGVRVVFRDDNVPAEVREARELFIEWLRQAPEAEVVSWREVKIEAPEPARIMRSVRCEVCGEAVMETRSREIDGRKTCIPCAENLKGGEIAS